MRRKMKASAHQKWSFLVIINNMAFHFECRRQRQFGTALHGDRGPAPLRRRSSPVHKTSIHRSIKLHFDGLLLAPFIVPTRRFWVEVSRSGVFSFSRTRSQWWCWSVTGLVAGRSSNGLLGPRDGLVEDEGSSSVRSMRSGGFLGGRAHRSCRFRMRRL